MAGPIWEVALPLGTSGSPLSAPGTGRMDNAMLLIDRSVSHDTARGNLEAGPAGALFNGEASPAIAAREAEMLVVSPIPESEK